METEVPIRRGYAEGDFNSTKVQFGASMDGTHSSQLGNFNSTKVQFGVMTQTGVSPLVSYFNSTKVQFGAVKLDRKYHINKGFEKRFR